MKALGFTPVIHSLVSDIGVHGALIYGHIWLNRNRDGVFKSSKQDISAETQLGLSTVKKWVNQLVDMHYLEDMTPDLKARPHHYRCIGPDIQLDISFKSSYPQGLQMNQPRGLPNDPQGSTKRPPVGLPNDPPIHDHDACKYIVAKYNHLWIHIGLDEPALIRFAKKHQPEPEPFGKYLERWVNAVDEGLIPDSWGGGLIYRKLESGELPPEKETWYDNEDIELFANGIVEFGEAIE